MMTQTTLNRIEDLLGSGYKDCESPSLRLNKFAHLGDDLKRDEIGAVVKCAQGIKYDPGLLFTPPRGIRFIAKLESRLIVNQAGGILENAGLCLHPHFGFPYIPGSAVKGIARHAAWCEWDDEKDPDRKREIADKIVEVFGFPTGDDTLDEFIVPCKDERNENARSGTISFLAAIPAGKATLDVDIVNCHHPKYYMGDSKQEEKEKAQPRIAYDNESPNPQFFPTVTAGTKFVFTLVPIRGGDLSAAKRWLLDAIQNFGAGAKTASGYGWFSYNEEDDKKWKTAFEKRKEENIQKRELDQIRIDLKQLKENGEDPLSSESVEKLTNISKKLERLDLIDHRQENGYVSELERRKPKEPKKSMADMISEEWAGKEPEKIVISSAYILRFKNWSQEDQKEIADYLVSGQRDDVWNFLKNDANISKLRKKHQKVLREAVQEIRKWIAPKKKGK